MEIHNSINTERAQVDAMAKFMPDMKYDNNKPIAGVLFEDFPNALEAVISIATFGAKKYQRNSWLTVSNAKQRYGDAMVRHQLAMGRGEQYDPESNLLHHAHFAWNALATLELLLRGYDGFEGRSIARPTVLPENYASVVIGERHIIGEPH